MIDGGTLNKLAFERSKDWAGFLQRFENLKMESSFDLSSCSEIFSDKDEGSGIEAQEIDTSDDDGDGGAGCVGIKDKTGIRSTFALQRCSEIVVDDDDDDLNDILNQTRQIIEAHERKLKSAGIDRILNTFDSKQIEKKVGGWLRQNNSVNAQIPIHDNNAKQNLHWKDFKMPKVLTGLDTCSKSSAWIETARHTHSSRKLCSITTESITTVRMVEKNHNVDINCFKTKGRLSRRQQKEEQQQASMWRSKRVKSGRSRGVLKRRDELDLSSDADSYDSVLSSSCDEVRRPHVGHRPSKRESKCRCCNRGRSWKEIIHLTDNKTKDCCEDNRNLQESLPYKKVNKNLKKKRSATRTAATLSKQEKGHFQMSDQIKTDKKHFTENEQYETFSRSNLSTKIVDVSSENTAQTQKQCKRIILKDAKKSKHECRTKSTEEKFNDISGKKKTCLLPKTELSPIHAKRKGNNAETNCNGVTDKQLCNQKTIKERSERSKLIHIEDIPAEVKPANLEKNHSTPSKGKEFDTIKESPNKAKRTVVEPTATTMKIDKLNNTKQVSEAPIINNKVDSLLEAYRKPQPKFARLRALSAIKNSQSAGESFFSGCTNICNSTENSTTNYGQVIAADLSIDAQAISANNVKIKGAELSLARKRTMEKNKAKYDEDNPSRNDTGSLVKKSTNRNNILQANVIKEPPKKTKNDDVKRKIKQISTPTVNEKENYHLGAEEKFQKVVQGKCENKALRSVEEKLITTQENEASESNDSDCMLVTSTTDSPCPPQQSTQHEQVKQTFQRHTDNGILLYTALNKALAPVGSLNNGRFYITQEHLTAVIGERIARNFCKYYTKRRNFDMKSTVYYIPPKIDILAEQSETDSEEDELALFDQFGELYEVTNNGK